MVCLVLIILCRIKEIQFFCVALCCCCCFSTYKYGNNMQNYPKMTLNSLKIARHRKTKGFTTVSSAKWIFYAEIVFSNKWHSKWQRLIWFYFRMSNAPRIIRFSSAKSINHVMQAIFWILFTSVVHSGIGAFALYGPTGEIIVTVFFLAQNSNQCLTFKWMRYFHFDNVIYFTKEYINILDQYLNSRPAKKKKWNEEMADRSDL